MPNDGADSQVGRDRAAIEAIVGHPVTGPWPAGAMAAGTRVRVIRAGDWDGPWCQEFEGTIDATFTPAAPPNPHARTNELEYSVAFDGPQYTTDGLGPYRKAVIWDRYLLALPSQPRSRDCPRISS